jgi:hypothetical protein
MSKHTPEPWVADHYDEGDWSIGTCEMDRTIAENAPCIPRLPTSESAANARRIVACVNACAGMDDPAAGIARLKAREAEMREAIVGSLITLRSSMGNTNKVMYTEAKLSRALLAHESAEPAEERGPEVGDIVAWVNSRNERMVGQFGMEITQGDAIVLMRRAEVEARMKGEGK